MMVSSVSVGYPFSMNFAQVAPLKRWPYFEVVHDYTPVVASTICHSSRGLMLRQGQLNHGRRVVFGGMVGLKDAVQTSNGGVWFGRMKSGILGA